MATKVSNALDWEKVKKRAPCAYLDGRHYQYPAVDCELECKTCPWNPRVHDHRMKTGEFLFNRKTRIKTFYIRKEKP